MRTGPEFATHEERHGGIGYIARTMLANFIRRFPWLAVVLGGIAGPLAYWGGARLGAVEFVAPFAATAALAVGWSALTPALLTIARRFDGVAPAVAPRLVPETGRA